MPHLPSLHVYGCTVKLITLSSVGAHSHIRGLGLDDALEPRQVCLQNNQQHYVLSDEKLCFKTYKMELFLSSFYAKTN